MSGRDLTSVLMVGTGFVFTQMCCLTNGYDHSVCIFEYVYPSNNFILSYPHWNNNLHLIKSRTTKCPYTINHEHYGFWTDGQNGVHVFCTTAEKL